MAAEELPASQRQPCFDGVPETTAVGAGLRCAEIQPGPVRLVSLRHGLAQFASQSPVIQGQPLRATAPSGASGAVAVEDRPPWLRKDVRHAVDVVASVEVGPVGQQQVQADGVPVYSTPAPDESFGRKLPESADRDADNNRLVITIGW